MHIDPPLLSALSALVGALMGGSASLAGAVYTQRRVSDGLRLDSDEHHLIGLANRMRLFAPRTVIDEAEAVIRGIVELSLQPGRSETDGRRSG